MAFSFIHGVVKWFYCEEKSALTSIRVGYDWARKCIRYVSSRLRKPCSSCLVTLQSQSRGLTPCTPPVVIVCTQSQLER